MSLIGMFPLGCAKIDNKDSEVLSISGFASPDDSRLGIIFFEVDSEKCADLINKVKKLTVELLMSIKDCSAGDSLFDKKAGYAILWMALDEIRVDFDCTIDAGITVLDDVDFDDEGKIKVAKVMAQTDVIHREVNLKGEI